MIYAPPPTIHNARVIAKVAVAETADLLDATRTTVSKACPVYRQGRRCIAHLHGAPANVARWKVFVRKSPKGDWYVSARPV